MAVPIYMARILGFFGKRKEAEERKDSAADVGKPRELEDKKTIYSSESGKDRNRKKAKRVPLFSAWKKWGKARKAGMILQKIVEKIRSLFRGAKKEEKPVDQAALRGDSGEKEAKSVGEGALRGDLVEFVVYDSDSDDGIDFVHESELLYGSLLFCSYEDLQRFEGIQRLFSSQQSISDCESDSEEDC